MPRLATDPDTLRIPAFMRKRTLRTAARKPLLLTALDRKKAGVKVAATSPKVVAVKKTAPRVRIQKAPAKKTHAIGVMTAYYGKIKVGVIKIASTLSVGESIAYRTREGLHTQLVTSMELDRQPIFTATEGQEIGLKLEKEPILEKRVLRASA